MFRAKFVSRGKTMDEATFFRGSKEHKAIRARARVCLARVALVSFSRQAILPV